MSLNVFKKQITRANQKLNEKLAVCKGTDKGEDYKNLTNLVDAHKKHLTDINAKALDVLQPNLVKRSKVGATAKMSKMQGRSEVAVYRQEEEELSELFNKFANILSQKSMYREALRTASAAFLNHASLKYEMEDDVREGFLMPNNHAINQQLKDISVLRKKCESARLDYDLLRKKRTDGKPDNVAEERASQAFARALEESGREMTKFLSAETERIEQLNAMVAAMQDYHTKSAELFAKLNKELQEKKAESERNSDIYPSSIGFPLFSTPSPNGAISGAEPRCRALYSFTPENGHELELAEGDIVKLLDQVDGQWFLGELNGRRGHFPITYVEVLTPLPSTEVPF